MNIKCFTSIKSLRFYRDLGVLPSAKLAGIKIAKTIIPKNLSIQSKLSLKREDIISNSISNSIKKLERLGVKPKVEPLLDPLLTRYDEFTILDILARNPKIVVYKTDLEGKIVWISQSVKEVLGYNHEDVIRNKVKFYDGIARPDLRDIAEKAFKKGLEEGKSWGGLTYFVGADLKTWHTLQTYFQTIKDENGNVTGAIGIAIDVSELKNAERELKKLVKTYATVKTIFKMISKETKLEEILEEITKEAVEILPNIHACGIKIFDKKNFKFIPVAKSRLDESWGYSTGKDLKKTLSYRSFNEKIIIGTSDIKKYKSTANEELSSGLYCPVIIRLKDKDETIGVINFYSKKSDAFTTEIEHIFTKEEIKENENLNIISLFLELIGMAISCAELHAIETKRKEEQIALNKISRIINSSLNLEKILDTLVNEAKNIFESGSKKEGGVRSCSVYIFDKSKNGLIRMASVGRDLSRSSFIEFGQEVTGMVAKTGKPLFVQDVKKFIECLGMANGARQGSFMSVPIKLGEEIIGVINIASEEENYFDEETDLPLILTLSDMAAIAIRNAKQMKELESLAKKNEWTAMLDPLLNGLFNQGIIPFILENELNSAKKKNIPLSLILMDIDNFKKVNDEKGHEFGDSILKRIGKILEGIKLFGGIPARLGGEELLIILPNCSIKYSIKLANLIREKIEKDVGVTVSIGVSAFPENSDKREILLRLADQAMYKAKALGKNIVVSA